MIKIGLRKSYDLMIALDTPVGRKYREMTQLRESLARRGTSILAHGLIPIERKDAVELFHAARELFMVEIKDFDASCARLQFPWIEPEA